MERSKPSSTVTVQARVLNLTNEWVYLEHAGQKRWCGRHQVAQDLCESDEGRVLELDMDAARAEELAWPRTTGEDGWLSGRS